MLPAFYLLGSSLARKTARPEGLAGLALQPLAQASMEPESSGGLAWPPGILPTPFTLHTGLPSQCMAGTLFPGRALVPEAVAAYGGRVLRLGYPHSCVAVIGVRAQEVGQPRPPAKPLLLFLVSKPPGAGTAMLPKCTV